MTRRPPPMTTPPIVRRSPVAARHCGRASRNPRSRSSSTRDSGGVDADLHHSITSSAIEIRP